MAASKRASVPDQCAYVYAIVDAAIHPGLVAGAARGAALELAAVDDVAAVFSWIDPAELEDLEPDVAEGGRLAKLVRRHDDVVMALALAGPVLPVRLGTLMPDRASLQKILTRSRQVLVEALDRVRGRAEWDMRVMPASGLPDHADEPALAHAGADAGTNYLLGRRDARRRESALRESLASAVAALDARLAALADAANGVPSAPGRGPASLTYLVADQAQEAFVSAAQEGIDELRRLGCTAALSGPLPAYSFVGVKLEALRDE
jgi:hypothetical protein